MYLWLISFKMGMKTGHAIPPSQADKPAKCHICPQLPLMRRHKRDIELPWKSPAMFVEYQLGLGPAWALFQNLEWEGEAFGCFRNMKQNEEKDLISKKLLLISQPNFKKKKSWRLSLASCCACCCEMPEVLCNRKTQSTVSYPSNEQLYFLFLAWLTTVSKSRLHFHPLQTPIVGLLHCRETNNIWVLFTAYITDSQQRRKRANTVIEKLQPRDHKTETDDLIKFKQNRRSPIKPLWWAAHLTGQMRCSYSVKHILGYFSFYLWLAILQIMWNFMHFGFA